MTNKTEKAIFGGGCFWCVEALFNRLNGVVQVRSGYAGGETANPIYHEVTTGKTGHAEVVEITYDPSVIPYDQLLEVFFAAHDATQTDGQGNDKGPSYRSIILYTTREQEEKATHVIDKMKRDGIPVVTEVNELKVFYTAEDYHQNYYENNSFQPYCSLVIRPKIEKLEKQFSHLLKKPEL